MAERPSPAAAPGTAGGRPPGLAVAVRTLQSAAVPGSVLLALLCATGCLYWLRAVVAGAPGPRVVDALPLDELAGHSAVPVVVYVPLYLAVGSLLGLLARRLGFGRLSAGLLLALSAGSLTFALDALSLFVVRQTGYQQALDSAGRLQVVYLTMLLVGLGGALFGRTHGRRTSVTGVLAWAVGLAGLLDLVSAIAPHLLARLRVLDDFVTSAVPPLANALVVPVGVVLLLASRGLARGSRRAWRLAVTLLLVSSMLHILKGLDYDEAIVTGTLAIALIARRRDFSAAGSPDGRPMAMTRLVTVAVGAYAYAFSALWVNRTESGLPVRLGPAALGSARAMIGLPLHGSQYYAGDFAEWFPWSVVAVVAVGAGWAVAAWIAPWRGRLSSDARTRARAADIVRRWGTDTLAPFALRRDKSLVIMSPPGPGTDGPAGDVLIAFRVVRGTALLTGDPVGPPSGIGPVFEQFRDEAHRRGWRIAVLGASERCLELYRRAGLRVLYHGDEAVVNTSSFSLESAGMRTVRQAVHRVERHGYRSEAYFAGELPPPLFAQLSAVEAEWIGGNERKGFVMQFDSLFSAGGGDALFVVARAADGGIGGFLHAAVCPASASLSLSAVPRRAATPNGLAAWLIVETIDWARRHDFGALSLNFAPFAGLLADGVELGAVQRLEREALHALKRPLSLQLDNLTLFNRKFKPDYRRRYVVYERRSELPLVAVAAMAAEGYLPFSGLARGRGWDRPEMAGDRPADRFPTEVAPDAGTPAGIPVPG